jgi:hypothetical protein
VAKRRSRPKADTISELVRKAETEGDKAALETLRQDHPEALGNYMVVLGDLRKATEEVILDAFIGEDLPITRRGVELRLEELREELTGPDSSPLERLLVERIVIAWVQANHSDLIAATSMKREAGMKERQHHLKVQDRATRRFLHACKVLAQVRKLLGPNIQVNIAEKQVNVSSGGRR